MHMFMKQNAISRSQTPRVLQSGVSEPMERASSDGHQNKCLLAKVQHAEPVGDEVQAFEKQGLGRLEDGCNPHPNRWECEKL